MPSDTAGPQVTVDRDAGPKLGTDADHRETDREDIYLDGTLVLVGCGKAKRDPDDPADLHAAAVGPGEPMSDLPGADTGPAWRAEDLYTSTYFAAKRDFAETVTAWASDYGAGPWAILSAEHGVVPHWRKLKPYDTSIDDLGDDPTDPDHRVDLSYIKRRPDGREVVTEMDQWAARVATTLCKWVAGFREQGALPWENDANQLLVLAGQDYLDPLRERGVFENGIARMTGNPNEGVTFPLRPRFLFEEIDADGIGEQMAWLSGAIERLDHAGSNPGDQHSLGGWTGDERPCEGCGESPPETQVDAYGSEIYCDRCAPECCARCSAWTHETGMGTYPLCPDCQTNGGGQKRTPPGEPPTTEQAQLPGADDAE